MEIPWKEVPDVQHCLLCAAESGGKAYRIITITKDRETEHRLID